MADPTLVTTIAPVVNTPKVLTGTAIDAVNGNSFLWNAHTVALIHNTHATETLNATVVTKQTSPQGFSKDGAEQTIALLAGEIGFIPFLSSEFASAGKVTITYTGTTPSADLYVVFPSISV
jgi:hypothetical protein